MHYSLANYQEIYKILEKENGIIESKYLEEIFYAFQIASGQEYFRSRTQAIIDYLNKNALLIVQYPNKQVEIRTLNELEKCFKTFDSEFKLEILRKNV
jgi:Ca2+-binding EF-hand superfamily protein